MRRLAVVAVFCISACGKDEPAVQNATPISSVASGDTEETPKPEMVEPPVTADPTKTGIVTGRVNVEGKVRMRPNRAITRDVNCAAHHPQPPLLDTVVVDKDNNVQWAFVYVTSEVKGRFPALATSKLLDQKGCTYTPHVLGIMPGQPLTIRSSDPFLHNVHGLGFENPDFNRGISNKGQFVHRFRTREVMYRIKCDVHSWMGAWVGVLDHPFFAVTAADGAFAIKGLPSGTHTIEVWHEKFKSMTAEVQVAAGQTKTVDFTLKQ